MTYISIFIGLISLAHKIPAYQPTTYYWSLLSCPKQPTEAEVKYAITIATQLWSQVTNIRFAELNNDMMKPNLTFSFGSIYHGDNYPFDGTGDILAHAFSNQIHIDADEHWAVFTGTPIYNWTRFSSHQDLISVLAHEIGHFLGLEHHFGPSSIMFPFHYNPPVNNGTVDKPTLSVYDIQTIQTLYGQPSIIVNQLQALPTYPSSFYSNCTLHSDCYYLREPLQWACCTKHRYSWLHEGCHCSKTHNRCIIRRFDHLKMQVDWTYCTKLHNPSCDLVVC